MGFLTVDMAKLSQRISGDDEDGLIQIYLDAAEEAAVEYLGRKVYVTAADMATAVLAGEAGEDPILVNAMIKAASLLIFGKLYANREDVIVGTISSELPGGSLSLLRPFRKGLGV